nr:hypothetical protein [Methylobacterium pseudosasicola]
MIGLVIFVPERSRCRRSAEIAQREFRDGQATDTGTVDRSVERLLAQTVLLHRDEAIFADIPPMAKSMFRYNPVRREDGLHRSSPMAAIAAGRNRKFL